MANISFSIPDAKLNRVLNAIAGTYPIPNNQDGSLQFTKGAWAKEYLRRLIVRTVSSYEKRIAGSAVIEDDEIIS